MNCHEARQQLADYVADALNEAEAKAMERHLRACAGCEKEHTAHVQVLQLLDTTPPLQPKIDVDAIYREFGRRQQRSARRWRRATVAAGLVAMGLFLTWVLGIQLVVERHQVIVRWGEAPTVKTEPIPKVAAEGPSAELEKRTRELEDRLNRVHTMIHAIDDRVKHMDSDHAKALLSLRADLARIHLDSDRRWETTTRRFQVLYTAQFGSQSEGE